MSNNNNNNKFLEIVNKDERDSLSKQRDYEKVKESITKYSLELSEEDFNRFINLQSRGKDIEWIMHKMSEFNMSLTDALILYITYM